MSSPLDAHAHLHEDEDSMHRGETTHVHMPAGNGRVHIDDRLPRAKYALYPASQQQQGGPGRPTAPQPVRHLDSIQTKSTLSEAFFSEANQTIIQNAIRYNVWKTTSNMISKQDSVQLQIIMRSIFLQHARHSQVIPVCEQVEKLNSRVLAYSLPQVTSNVKQYMHYKQDVSKLPEPFEHPVNMSQKGSKTLSTHPFV
jgi:hypothetical protein